VNLPFRPKKYRLRTRFVTAMSITLLPLAILAGGSFFALNLATKLLGEVIEDPVREMHAVMHLQGLIGSQLSIYQHLSTYHLHDRMTAPQLDDDVSTTLEKALATPTLAPDQRTALEGTRHQWQAAMSLTKQLETNFTSIETPEAQQSMATLVGHLRSALQHLHHTHMGIRNEMNQRLSLANTMEQRVLWLIGALFVVGFGIVALGSFMLTHSILSPLNQLEQGASRFGEGRFDHRVDVDSDDEMGELAMTFNAMASKIQDAYSELAFLSSHDGLTGLYNHKAFQERLVEEVERAERYGHSVALLMLDIDHFKQINDTHGHPAGDAVLRMVAEFMRGHVRPSDHVARYGGEEFTILLPHASQSGALTSAERLRRTIETRAVQVTKEVMLKVTVSIGVAVFPDDVLSADKLISAADHALYAAKQAGRNRVRTALPELPQAGQG